MVIHYDPKVTDTERVIFDHCVDVCKVLKASRQRMKIALRRNRGMDLKKVSHGQFTECTSGVDPQKKVSKGTVSSDGTQTRVPRQQWVSQRHIFVNLMIDRRMSTLLAPSIFQNSDSIIFACRPLSKTSNSCASFCRGMKWSALVTHCEVQVLRHSRII